MQPTIKATSKRRLHTVCVTLVTERSVQFSTLVRATVTIGVPQKPDVGNAPGDNAVLIRINTSGNVQPVCKSGNLVVTPIASGILKNLDRVASVAIRRCRIRILQRAWQSI